MQPQAAGIDAFNALFNQQYPRRYDDWLKKAEAVCQKFRKTGVAVVRAHMDLGEFTAFCDKHGFSHVATDARTQFANFKAYEWLTSNHQSSSPAS